MTVVMFIPSFVFAGTELRNIGSPDGGKEAVLFVRPFCQFGYQFVVVIMSKTNSSYGSGGISVVQIMLPSANGPVPMPCKSDSNSPTVLK